MTLFSSNHLKITDISLVQKVLIERYLPLIEHWPLASVDPKGENTIDSPMDIPEEPTASPTDFLDSSKESATCSSEGGVDGSVDSQPLKALESQTENYCSEVIHKWGGG